MKIIAVIPARYNSSRLHGKPLADIHGKPMIWWVYNQVKKVDKFHGIYVATDDDLIKQTCEEFGMTFVMTSSSHETMSSRISEVSEKIDADVYVVVNGDEPLIEPSTILEVIPNDLEGFYASNLTALITDPAEVLDVSNIKVVFNEDNKAVYMSRMPVPYPKSTVTPKYFKHLGVIAYSKQALDFFKETKKGIIESVEDIDYLRFIENGKKFEMIQTNATSISVDTPKDLEKVRKLISLI